MMSKNGRRIAMQQCKFDRGDRKVQQQQKLYHQYALAAEAYVKMPTIYNWEKKEEAFETYNASIQESEA